MYILVIDVGTSSIRGVLYDPQGKPLFWKQISYCVQYFGEGMAEQNADDWANAVCVIGKAAAEFAAEKKISIDGISLTSQRSSIIPVGENGEALRPAIMWQDKRNAGIVAELASCQEKVHRLAGARINTVFSGTKMTWFRRMEPELYKKTKKICTIADYIVSRITGKYVTDHTYGARSLLMNIRTLEWDPELLDIFEVDREKLCALAPTGSVIGTVSREFAEKTGLKSGIPLVSAGGDQQCAALGQGIIHAGSAEITTGTGAFLLAYSDIVPEEIPSNIICGAHAIPGKYVMESSMLSCAAMYNWIMRTLFSEEKSIEAVNAAVERAPAGANGCIVLPYFQGRGSPDFNSNATGCFANMNLGTTRDDMARALLESIAYEANENLQILEKNTGKIEEIQIGGGLTRFSAFNQMQADVYQKKLLHDKDSSEQTAIGAWVSAAVALNACESYEKALSFALAGHSVETYMPNEKISGVYQQGQKHMQELYRKLYI